MSDEETQVEEAQVYEGPSKVVIVRASVGADDERTMEEFTQDIRAALEATWKSNQDGDVPLVKNVTFLSESYIVDGQTVSRSKFEEGDEDDDAGE